MKYKCPECGKLLIEENQKNFLKGDLIIKSRLVFLNQDGKILCKCQDCHHIISLPLNFNFKSNTIQER